MLRRGIQLLQVRRWPIYLSLSIYIILYIYYIIYILYYIYIILYIYIIRIRLNMVASCKIQLIQWDTMGVSVPRLVSRPVTFQKLPLSTHQRCTLGSGELDQRAVRQGGSGTWDGCHHEWWSPQNLRIPLGRLREACQFFDSQQAFRNP